ncbi:pilus assembly protein TadG-related protein [Janibacter sp. DB-40]|uniref:pilus assembly protein TadG-related protein n=1 Tax=Janibacter sp. DB-40 TaxID=3028808 RepID=UPI002406F23C|nr:pilus assembly protein TadG-related protein [Janibacter sp. DB-40]
MTLIVMVAILLLGFAMLFGVRLSKATDEASGLQTAADAAALAGAQSIVADAPGQIVSALVSGEVIPGSLGQAKAEDFASRNGATLVSYSYSPSLDRIRVTVESKDVLESGQRERRSAAAKLGMPFSACGTSQEPPAPSTSSSSSSSSPTSSTSSSTTPPSVDDVSDTLECGGLDIPVVWEWDEDEGWDLDSHVDASLIKDLDLEPALTD